MFLAALTALAAVLAAETPGHAAAPPAGASFHLEQVESLRCADVRAEDNDQAPGARVQLKPCKSGDVNQEWTPILLFGTTYSLQVTVSHQCMDLEASSTGSGTQVVQEPCNPRQSTQWFTYDGKFPTQNGTVIQVATHTANCLDSQDPFVKIFPCVPAGPQVPVAQIWFFTP